METAQVVLCVDFPPPRNPKSAFKDSLMRRVVVVGSSNTDMTGRVPVLPAAGQTVLGDSFATTPGGKGANTSRGGPSSRRGRSRSSPRSAMMTWDGRRLSVTGEKESTSITFGPSRKFPPVLL